MTANDSDVSDGEILTGSQVVRVYGENLTAPFVTLTFGDVEYTPLAQGEGYIEYVLNDNGSAIIAVDGSRFMSFEVDGIVPPADLSGRVVGMCSNNQGQTDAATRQETSAGCLYYPFKVGGSVYQFRVDLYFNDAPEITQQDITTVGCTITWFNVRTDIDAVVMTVVPTSADSVLYLIYEGFIFFVGNYTTE